MLSSHWITGGGGVRLHVVETGNPRGQPVLFIHGISQSWLCWRRQLDDPALAAACRLVAVDLRGHGRSDKPREGYGESALWAADIDAVIRALHLDRPILCGWSYGPYVILDYIRHHGEHAIGGLHFVGATTTLGTEEALTVLTPELLALGPGLFSTQTEESVRALEALLRLCFVGEPGAEELYLMLGYNLAVPPYVRRSMFSRTIDNDDLLPRIRRPVLVTHGTRDAVVRPEAVARHMAGLRHKQVHVMEGAGHACCLENAEEFNQRLREFVVGVA